MTEIAGSYLDVWQREQKIDPDTRRALEDALGPKAKGKVPAMRIEPGACHQPELLEPPHRLERRGSFRIVRITKGQMQRVFS